MANAGIRNILVPTDFSDASRSAAGFARDLAEQLGADVHLMHVHATHEHHPLQRIFSGLRESGQSVPSVEEHVREQLEETRAGMAGTQVHIAYLEGENVVGTVVAHAMEIDADLIVVGRREHRALPNITSGTLGIRLAGAAGRAILIVPEERPARVHHIGVPVDFSDAARSSVAKARTFADLYGARLSLIYVAERRVVPVFQDTGLFSIEVLEPDPGITARAREALVQLYQGTAGPDVNVEYAIRDGDTESQLLDYISETSVDLLMMPSHGLGRVRRSGLGGTTERMIRRAPCAVLVTQAPKEQEARL